MLSIFALKGPTLNAKSTFIGDLLSFAVFLSCKNALKEGYTASGIYDLLRNDGSTYKAYCDQETDGGGWTMLQRRVDTKLSFRRTWVEYENGFGNLSNSFWLGLKMIHELTTREPVSFRVDLKNVSL